jgi:hypothetical protein
MTDFKLPSYAWRGRVYKTLGRLHNAMLKTYPNTAISFDKCYCYLRTRTNAQIVFARSIDAAGVSQISTGPIGVADIVPKV